MHQPLAVHRAFEEGDLNSLKTLLGNPPDFPNCPGLRGAGDIILEYAIYHSPLPFIRQLLDLGADPNYGNHAGYPSLIAALSGSNRQHRLEILELLLAHGADIQQYGINGYTPLHWAASEEDIPAMEWLLAHGADLHARTLVDDYATPLEEMEILGKQRAIEFLKKALNPGP
ncbi:MAG: ankyrin repeat domain-containing protein [Gammaproteobacteria bacterium]|nr:ankyrin repeat domain-containing protein [Gammaproteobacteria bacterium]